MWPIDRNKKHIIRFLGAGRAKIALSKTTDHNKRNTVYLVAWDWRFEYHRVLVDLEGTWSPVGLIQQGFFTVNDEATAWLTIGAFPFGSSPWLMAMDVLEDIRRKRAVIRHTDDLRPAWAVFGLRPMGLNPTDVRVRRFAWLWNLLNSEVPLPIDLELLHDGHCARCQQVMERETDLDRGYCGICARELLEPSGGLHRATPEQLVELHLDEYTPWLKDSPFIPPGYEPPAVPAELLEPPDNPFDKPRLDSP